MAIEPAFGSKANKIPSAMVRGANPLAFTFCGLLALNSTNIKTRYRCSFRANQSFFLVPMARIGPQTELASAVIYFLHFNTNCNTRGFRPSRARETLLDRETRRRASYPQTFA
jgi:hypothetical protein